MSALSLSLDRDFSRQPKQSRRRVWQSERPKDRCGQEGPGLCRCCNGFPPKPRWAASLVGQPRWLGSFRILGQHGGHVGSQDPGRVEELQKPIIGVLRSLDHPGLLRDAIVSTLLFQSRERRIWRESQRCTSLRPCAFKCVSSSRD